MRARQSAISAVTLLLVVGAARAQPRVDAAAIDRAVIAKLSKQFGIKSRVIRHLDLTEPFQTTSKWSFVVAKQPDETSNTIDATGGPIGALFPCFVKNGEPECSLELFPKEIPAKKYQWVTGPGIFFEHFAGDIVFSGPEWSLPLLHLKYCRMFGMNGDCAVWTFLFRYDREADTFRLAFSNVTGRNNNQVTRFVEAGPLLGSVIVAYPTENAPYTYFVEVHQRTHDNAYSRVLRYRGRTHYGDGNRLSVIDSEMPETLRRLGLWKDGDPLPMPPRIPNGCSGVVMRKGLLWCAAGTR